MAVSRILSPEFLRGDDHLSQSRLREIARRIFIHRGATNPRIDGPAVLPLFCLAPYGVFPASRITPRAVSSYLAFSPLPDLCCQRTGGVFSVTLSVTAIPQSRDCDARVFYAACCRMVFGLSSSEPCDSPAIICHRAQF